MAERNRARWEPAREATLDGSRDRASRPAGFRAAKPLPLAITVAGAVAAVLLVWTEFSTVASVDVASGSCEVINDTDPALADRCELSGLERNGGAFLLLAALTLLMSWGAGVGGSRPAALALVFVGVFVLGWALIVDLPVTDETGAIGLNFEGATARAGPGLTIEIVAGALALGAGVAGFLSAPVVAGARKASLARNQGATRAPHASDR